MRNDESSCCRNKFSVSVLVFALIFFMILSFSVFAEPTKTEGQACGSGSECYSGRCEGGVCISGGGTTMSPTSTSTTTPPTSTTTTTYQGTTSTTSGGTTSTTYQGQGTTSTTYGGTTSTTYSGTSFCGEGPITSSCSCGGATYTSGYCCANVYQATYCTHTTATTYSGTTYTQPTYTGGTKSDGSSCSLNNECRSNFCSGGVCTSSGPGYPGTTYPTYTGGTYPSTTYEKKCSAGTPWFCYSESDCKSAGANWCPPMSGGPYTCQSSPCSTERPGPTYSTVTTYQTCEQKTVSAVDDAGHCAFYNSPCYVPSGWKVVDKCPEYKPKEGEKGPAFGGPQVPEGCHRESSYSGERVICPQKNECPTLENEQQQKEKCKTEGGNPIIFKSQNGCNTMQCQFDSSKDLTYGGGGFTRPLACPPKSQIDADAEKCEKFGGKPVMKTVSGCVYADCLTGGTFEKEKEKKCPQQDAIARERKSCEERGGDAVPFFDKSGCEVVHCRVAGEECKKVPEEAFIKCSEEGGQLVVRNNDRGCSEFAKCVKKGSSSDIEYEKVEEVPDTSELLKLALKLEIIKVEMSKLSNKTTALAEYWKGAGNEKEQKRFERVAGMLSAAVDKIDEIKNNLAEKLKASGIKAQHIIDFKHDLKYIKQVVFENVLYVMLSSEGADAKLVERADASEVSAKGQTLACGSDGMCFDENVRACNPSTFNPETFVNVVIGGLTEDGKACSIRVEMTPPFPGQEKKTFVADCKYDKYIFGMRGPDDLVPTCTGDGVEIMKKFATEGTGAGPGGPGGPGPQGGGPGGCKSDSECRDYCYEHFEECKKFSKDRGFEKDFKEEYKRQSEQYSSGGYGPPPGYGDYGPPGYGGGEGFGPPPIGEFQQPPGGYPQPPGSFPQGPQQPFQPQQPYQPPATTAQATTSTFATTVTTAQATTTTAAPTTTLPPTTTTTAAPTTTTTV